MHQERKETPAAFLKEGVLGERKSQWSGMSSALEAAPSGMRAEMLKELAFYGGCFLLPTTPQVFPPPPQEGETCNERNTQGLERSRKRQALVRGTLYVLATAVMVTLASVFSSAAFAATGSPPCTTLWEDCLSTPDVLPMPDL